MKNCLSLIAISLAVSSQMTLPAQAQVLASTSRHAGQRAQPVAQPSPVSATDNATKSLLKLALAQLEKRHGISFIYRSELVDMRVLTPPAMTGHLHEDLTNLLEPNHLTFEKVRADFYIIRSKEQKEDKTLRQLKRAGLSGDNAGGNDFARTGQAIGSLPISPNLESRISRAGLFVNALVQDRTVTGRITDENGAGLAGATIAVKGTSRGTSANADGDYSISVPGDNVVLIISYIGYVPQEVSLGNRSVVNLTLATDVKTLQEVQINIGYGTASRQDVVGSLAIAGRKEFGNVNVQNASQLIQGKISGVQVVNNDGLPGSGTKIVIRGTGSLTSSDPLYVIDGIQSDGGVFNALNPQDVESITVLKDASSIAIYGAKGANGIVLVSTRRAKTGAPRVSYSGYVGFAQPWKKLDLMNAAQYVDLVKDIASSQQTTLPAKLSSPDALIDRTDWQDAVFRNGQRQEHYLNVNGGTEKVTYLASLGYTNQDATVIGRNFQRSNLRFQLEEKIGKTNRVRLGQNINFRYQVNNGNTPDFIAATRMPPYAPIYDANNLGGFAKVTTINDLNDAYNPLTDVYLSERRDRDFLTYVQLFGEIDLAKGLTFRTQGSLTFSSYGNYNYKQANQNGNLTNPNGISEYYGFGVTPLIENFLTFNRDFGPHHLNIVAGNTYKDGALYRNVNLNGSNFPNDDIKAIIVAPSSSIQGGSVGQDAFLSYFGRVQYQFMSKYLLTASIRRDRSPAFPNNPNAYFPAVGVAWKLHEEAFMKEIPFVSELKLRASYGKAGNDNIGYFRTSTNVWKGVANNIVYSLGPDKGYVQGSTVNQAINPNIRWEETVQTDVGIDAALFSNRLTLTFDYYNRQNNGLLTNVYIPLSTGFGGPYDRTGIIPTNAASAYNRGFEITAGVNGNAGGLRYSVGANASYNKNQVTSLGSEGSIPIIAGGFQGVASITRTDIGQPIGSFYGYKVDHVAINKADVAKYGVDDKGNSTYQDKLLPGDIIFKDLNADGKIDEKDQTFLGSPIPAWNYGLNLNLDYQNFDFMLSLQGVGGVQIVNALKYWTEGTTRPFNSSAALLSRWRKEGDISVYPKAGQNANGNLNLRPSDRFVENGDYMRIRNVTLGYRLPVPVLSKLTNNTVSNLRLYVTAQNLLTITNYSGYDPEVSSIDPNNNGGSNFLFNRGIDQGSYPQARTFIFGLQVGF
ncbi:SusC/RagA family TonB-linked outer membrane protein [Fibrella aquatilis]|uniref:TonB-dependent receptor n=1 Tax=Fibrella aquatilis TaxID=2817059 RepID=A0A939GB40_9BACT|nr:TonB-dependent receptor [Fibrella aquatilis]MBO0933989.1 TonB-dependent receptor [Fibrella aquatilis]